jgi:hypothetical protein
MVAGRPPAVSEALDWRGPVIPRQTPAVFPGDAAEGGAGRKARVRGRARREDVVASNNISNFGASDPQVAFPSSALYPRTCASALKPGPVM